MSRFILFFIFSYQLVRELRNSYLPCGAKPDLYGSAVEMRLYKSNTKYLLTVDNKMSPYKNIIILFKNKSRI